MRRKKSQENYVSNKSTAKKKESQLVSVKREKKIPGVGGRGTCFGKKLGEGNPMLRPIKGSQGRKKKHQKRKT